MSHTSRPLRAWFSFSPRDIPLFLKSARTDSLIARLRATHGARAAFEDAYTRMSDPWASADPRYGYQRRKYADMLGALPLGRRYARALDLGCGVGLMSLAITSVAEDVLGLDIAQAAVLLATVRAAGRPGLRFEQGDIGALAPSLDGCFDLVIVADALYYLDATDDLSLHVVVARIVRLLAPGGLCLVANHYFFAGDRESRLSRRIHDAFALSPNLAVVSAQRRAFYLLSVLSAAGSPG